ncbi:amidinotransferase [Candidatus Saccharibacteria bacterium]|nr:MAG: amidinotransferase [Candidatus Saccharibacteria bacterium]
MEKPSSILMVRPHRFGYNRQTAVDNHYQTPAGTVRNARGRAQDEFDTLVGVLTDHHVDITVVNDTPTPHTPDSLFPNNWFSTHSDGQVIIYPMKAENRRHEINKEVLPTLREKFRVESVLDLSHHAETERYLEGTGSIVFDHVHRVAYAGYSQRTDPELLAFVSEQLGYTVVGFHATDTENRPIYHTNVLMAVADRYAVVCLEALREHADVTRLRSRLEASDKRVIEITQGQVQQFAGNMLQVWDHAGNPFLVMSEQARQSLTESQLSELESYNPLISSAIPTIEKLGGGSVRCMMAEIYLTPHQ